ncbi:hypothetical protein RFI_29572 [Reticulomyxa filosa]|uniref:Uncharacterized protein n=1 Tax=Reticulomyxa filosa TaxID=46433 RepID=X6M2Y0_RETFI|nr:hypothetical protein RFI_29572 [Reticulomyxa filosa]|eukprot:ETO07817.1 hypothetical protein RFI_29572 [Reticulomyxa filosa]
MTNDATKKTGQELYTSSFIAQFIEKSLDILKPNYPKNNDERMWIIEWEISKSFHEQLIQKFRREKTARKLALITAKDTQEKKSDDNKQDEGKKKTTEEKKQIDKEEEKKKQRKPMI